MTVKPKQFAFVLVIALAGATVVRGQETGKAAKDAELESLLENLKDREEATKPSSKKAAKPAAPPQAKSQTGQPATTKKSASASGAKQGAAKSGGGGGQTKPAAKPPGTGGLAPKDQAIDDLLGKLGETKDEPAREERPQNQGAGQPPPERKPGEKDGAKLGGNDKEIDDRLEEIAGRRRKKPHANDEERSGPVGEMIKEMRDVEQRLGKPDPSEDTQAKQKQIIKNIDKLIEQVRQSGSSAGKLTMRRRQQQGNQQGQQQGDQPGAMAQGAGSMKAVKPTSQHSTAGGKGIWGHLPEELRQVMDNSFKEVELGSKAEMISRYFLSVGKGKLVREE